ncbi:MAG: hypothetical protein ABI665_28165 [Vicinamibacterales bacterium]
MSEKKKHLLSLLGVVLSIVAFCVSNASSLPFLQSLLSPSYVSAKRAIERIQRDGVLQSGQPDFAALSEVVEARIAAQNPLAPRSAIVLERLEATGGGIAFGAAASKQVVGLKVTLRGQAQPLQWDLLELAEVVEETWTSKSFRWAAWLFALGIVQTVWPLWLDLKPTKPTGLSANVAPADASGPDLSDEKGGAA